MPLLARMFDVVSCMADVHGWVTLPVTGMFTEGSTNVLANSRPAVRLGDGGPHVLCPATNRFAASAGSPTVLINSQPAVRDLDPTLHCGASPGFVVSGLTSPNIIVGP